jgi:hypothetical protein
MILLLRSELLVRIRLCSDRRLRRALFSFGGLSFSSDIKCWAQNGLQPLREPGANFSG